MSCYMENGVDTDLDLHCFRLSFISGFILFLKNLCMVSAKLGLS